MRRAVFASVVLFALAACSGGGSTTTAAPPGPPCPVDVTDTQAKLTSPPAGATGVSPTIGSLTFSYSLQESASSVYYWLAPSDGSAGIGIGTFGQNNGVTVLSPGVATMNVPPLKSGVTYSVAGSNVDFAHLVCFRYVTVNLGSFTTR
jgi:hypothetical protein